MRDLIPNSAQVVQSVSWVSFGNFGLVKTTYFAPQTKAALNKIKKKELNGTAQTKIWKIWVSIGFRRKIHKTQKIPYDFRYIKIIIQ